MRLTLASLLAVFVLAPLAIAAVPPVAPELRSFLESTHELSTFFTRDSRVETRRKETATTVSHIDKTDGSKEQAKYTRLPPNTYCKDRSAVTAGDQDLLNKPSTNTHPLPGQREYPITRRGQGRASTVSILTNSSLQPPGTFSAPASKSQTPQSTSLYIWSNQRGATRKGSIFTQSGHTSSQTTTMQRMISLSVIVSEPYWV